jgi:glycine oxidase
LLEPLGTTSGILPIRGQIVLFRPRERLLTSIVNEGHRYLVSRDDGRVLVGSNEEEVGFVCQTTPEIIAELCAWARRIMPALGDAEVERTWAGLRPGSFDSYPYIGRLPTCPNLYVAAGHYRAGIHLSCGTAQVVADLITTDQTSIDLFPFRPGRG